MCVVTVSVSYTHLKAGDILVTSRGTIGKCYILADDDAFYFQDGMISWLKAKCDCRLLPEFTAALFAEEGFLKTLDEVTKDVYKRQDLHSATCAEHHDRSRYSNCFRLLHRL